MLHTVNKSPFVCGTLESCLGHLREGHAVLLIEDGVYGATAGTRIQPRLLEAMKSCTVYALQADVEARGLQGRLIEGVVTVDYGGFVELAVRCETVQSWL
jgi:tRNA 2-thiouridine synthesizing protein B